MSVKMKIILSSIIGMLGGIACWPVIESFLHIQNDMPSIIIANCILGGLLGIFLGFFLGSIDGVIVRSSKKLTSGIIWGVTLGLIGGAIGGLIGRTLIIKAGDYLFRINNSFSSVLIVVLKGIGWSILGAFIGIGSGIVLHSKGKIRLGAIGGLIGGLVGGILFEIIIKANSNENFARFIGLAILGLLIGLFLSLTEKVLSKGIIRILNGRLKGKEYVLAYNRIKIGRSEKSDVGLFGFKNVANRHAEIKRTDNNFTIYDGETSEGIMINNKLAKKQSLKSGDIITLGDAKVLFLTK